MPWNPAQTRLFMAAAHDPEIAESHDIKPAKAREMAMESPPKARSNAMKQAALANALRNRPPVQKVTEGG